MEKKINKNEEKSDKGSLCKSNMSYPTWKDIKELLGVQFDKPNRFGNNPLSKGHDPIYSYIKEEDNEKTPCGIDIPVLLKPESETKQPLIVILGESALRSKAELKDIKDPRNAPSNVILGTPYAIHLKECPPKCGVYRKIVDAILKERYPIYITDIIKVWSKDKELVPDENLDITVFNKELNELKKKYEDIIIVAWGKTAQNGLEKVRKSSKEKVPPSLSLPHPGQKNWNAWKLRIFEKAVFSGKLEYATRLYGEDPNGNENKTTAEKVAGEAVQSIDDYINDRK